MKLKIYFIVSVFILFFLSNFVYAEELNFSIKDDVFSVIGLRKSTIEDKAMTGIYENEDVLYPPESELRKQGLTLRSYKQQLKETAPNNRTSTVDNIWGTTPLSGTVHIPVLLVQFTDKSPTYTQAQINEVFNSPTVTADTISVSKYYYKQSYGDLNLVFDVYNWTTMPQTFAYYTNNHNYQLVLDAYSTFNSSVNFAQYDNDNDGRIDGVVIIPAGNQGASLTDPYGIWPQARILRNYNSNPVDGKYLGNAALVPEKKNNQFQERNTIMHEFAHVLGLPDLYSIDPVHNWNSDGPIKGLTMMIYDTGDCKDKPMNLDVWSRYFLGWIEPEILTIDSNKNISLRSVNDYPDAVILRNSNMGPREYFIIENRHKNLSDTENLDNCVFDGTPMGGTLIYHVDENKIEAHYPNNWVNWDPDGNYFDDTSWPGITNEVNYLPGGVYSTAYDQISYNNYTYPNGCNQAYFDENNHICPWRPFSMTTRSYSGNLNPLIRFQAISPRNEYTMTAKMLVGEETITPIADPPTGTYTVNTQATLSTATPNAIIYYTTNGTDPTTSSPIYTSPITVTEGTTTIKAIAKRNDYYVSDVMSSTYTITGTVATPTANQTSGVVDYLSQVILSTTTPGATIRYTLDGSEPTENSEIYSSPIAITQSLTLKAKAFLSGWNPSETATYDYQVMVVETPVSTLVSGYYYYGTTLELYTPTVGSSIRYTTNGNEPTESSALYSGPIAITYDFTLKAKAFKQGYVPSQTSTYVYDTGAAPENLIVDFIFQGIDSNATIDNDQNLVSIRIPYGINRANLIPIIEVEEGCNIYPESGVSQNFNNPVTYTVSSITGQRVYTVIVINNPRVFAPIASVSGGNYNLPITVELSTQTPGAIIKYTTNGSFPTLSSNTYNGPININSTTTLKAKTYLYVGPQLSSNSSSRGSTSPKNIQNLVPAPLIWVSSSVLTEEYIFPRKTPSKNKQEIIVQKEKTKLNISSEK